MRPHKYASGDVVEAFTFYSTSSEHHLGIVLRRIDEKMILTNEYKDVWRYVKGSQFISGDEDIYEVLVGIERRYYKHAMLMPADGIEDSHIG